MNRSNVEEIKARLPIEDVLGTYIKLEKSGKSYKAKCPFHNEKTASFFVSPDRGGYYCFGCGAKGDIFSFVEHFEGLDFKGALKVLADRAGIQLTFDTKADGERDRLFTIMEMATKYFEDELAKNKEALDYVKKRGVSDKTRQEFRIGYAPEGWRNLYTFLQSKKFSNELIEKAGLAKKAEDNTGNYYDRFRGRVMFPISDSSGRIIAFSGRLLKDDGKSAKYLNSPDTPLFDKSAVLYGLDKAKSYIRRLDYSILVEGQMDLIMSHQAGVKNTVASSGTALTDAEAGKSGAVSNLGVIRRLSGNVIIAFDSDAAGRKAAMRAANIALSLGMDVKIADIQGGKDPADLVLHSIEDWKNVLRSAKPVIEFELNNVLKEVTDPRKVPRALRERVFPFIANVESHTDRAYFVKLVSDKANLPEDDIRADIKSIAAKMKSEPEKPTVSIVSGRGFSDSRPEVRRIDLVERRMFGLLDLMNQASHPKAAYYAEQIQKIAGDSFLPRAEKSRSYGSDIHYEAEAFFGSKPEKWEVHMADLIQNFEENLLSDDLISTMNELRLAEKSGSQELVKELAKKCQALSIRKAEIAKHRK